MIPKQLVYQNKVESAAARSYKSNIAPQNGTGNYGVGDTIIINIPTRANLVTAMSENYLKFDVSFTNGGAASDYLRWDSSGAHGLIQRVRVFSGSNLLSDIDNYGLLSKMLFDVQVPTDSAYGKYNILVGCRPDLTTQLTLPATDPTDSAGIVAALKATRYNSSYCSNSGIKLNTSATAVAANAVVSGGTYCLNLVSLVGSLCSEKYFPLFACTSAPLRVEIQLVNSPLQAICAHKAVASFTISNCEYIANMIELSDSAMQVITGSTGENPLQFVFSDYRNFVYSYTQADGAATTVNVPIAAKYASLKSILVAMRDTSKSTAITYFPLSSHHFNLLDYTFRIGPNVVPSKAPNTYPEMFSELVKTIGSMSDINHQPSIDFYSYSGNFPKGNSGGLPTTAGTAASSSLNFWGPIANATETLGLVSGNVNSGSFYIGVDLENYTSADRSTVFAGYNSNTDDIYLNANFGGVSGGIPSHRFDSYAIFDSVLVFQNGTAYVKF